MQEITAHIDVAVNSVRVEIVLAVASREHCKPVQEKLTTTARKTLALPMLRRRADPTAGASFENSLPLKNDDETRHIDAGLAPRRCFVPSRE